MANFLNPNDLKRKISRMLYQKKISFFLERLLRSLDEVEKLLGIR